MHHLPSPYSVEFTCGRSAWGARSTRQLDPANVTCSRCLAALAGKQCEAGRRNADGTRSVCTKTTGHTGEHDYN